MKTMKCPHCGSQAKGNGKTKAGRQRWRCRVCGSSFVRRRDGSNRNLGLFPDWLLPKDVQLDMPGCGRTSRRRVERFWKIWPMPPTVDEIHRVVHVDGTWLGRDAVILIACSEEHVPSWHLARAENSISHGALLPKIAPPGMVASDGGRGSPRHAAGPGPA